jgi:hypothetical protein
VTKLKPVSRYATEKSIIWEVSEVIGTSAENSSDQKSRIFNLTKKKVRPALIESFYKPWKTVISMRLSFLIKKFKELQRIRPNWDALNALFQRLSTNHGGRHLTLSNSGPLLSAI